MKRNTLLKQTLKQIAIAGFAVWFAISMPGLSASFASEGSSECTGCNQGTNQGVGQGSGQGGPTLKELGAKENEDGKLVLSERPGLGIELDAAAVKHFEAD
jgi:hypothetical protein